MRRGLLAFNTGVDNSPAYKPEVPLLSLGPSLLFLLGFVLALWHIKELRYALLAVWVVVTLVFGAVLLENPPNSHRLIVAAPALSLLAAVALVWLGRLVMNNDKDEEAGVTPRSSFVLLSVLLVIAVALAGLDLFFYFGRYQNQHTFGDRNTEIADDMSDYLNTLSGDWTAYFYGPPSMYVGFPTIPFLAQDFHENVNLFDVPPQTAVLPPTAATKRTFIFLPERLDDMGAVQNQFPDGELQTVSGFHADPLFYIYEVEN